MTAPGALPTMEEVAAFAAEWAGFAQRYWERDAELDEMMDEADESGEYRYLDEARFDFLEWAADIIPDMLALLGHPMPADLRQRQEARIEEFRSSIPPILPRPEVAQ